ncbi:MAG: uncharacterized membrane-anchored protein YjiN (DUF445 family) [Candidatus Azotimanducaceae bacterium]|jgi:uncharacterized membrane-anchored protein YjiN (DUF445 family)
MTQTPMDQNPARIAELNRMKLLATGLLFVVALIYVVSAMFESQYYWVSYINAASEAAMVGAIADWFAVSALFKHPLGLKIPHTAIIPTRKNDIAEQFGAFVQANFLSEDVITEKIRAMKLSRRVAAWLIEPKNARALSEQMTTGLAGVVKVINDDTVQEMIERKVEDRIRETSFAPMIGDLLTFITSGRRQQSIFDGAVNMGLYMLEDSDRDIRDKVQEETPWWFPNSVDKAIYQRIIRSVSKMMYEMQTDIDHPVRVRLVNMMTDFMEDLRHSADIQEKEIALKEDLLQAPAVAEFTHSLWQDIKSALVRQSENPDAELKQAIEQAVISFGQSILEDEALAQKIDGWAEDGARHLINTYGHEIAALISETIDGWDPQATSIRIEEQIGKDLQFIRINGTVVGGLVGLSIHGIRESLEHFGPSLPW